MPKIVWKSIIRVPRSSKIYQNGAQECSESDLGRRSSKWRPRKDENGGLWVPLGDFGRHVGTQLGAKGLPKSSFLAPSPPKNLKNYVQGKVLEKSWKVDQQIFRKCEFLNVLNPPKCFIYKHLGGFRRLRQSHKFYQQSMPKLFPKGHPNRHLGAQGSDFWDLGMLLVVADL